MFCITRSVLSCHTSVMGSLAGWFDLSREFHGPSVAQPELLGLTFCNNLPSCPAIHWIVSVSQSVQKCRNEWWYCRSGPRGTDYARWVLGSQIMSSDLVLLTVAPGWRGGQTSVSRITIISQYDTVRLRRDRYLFLTNKQTSRQRQTHDQIWPLNAGITRPRRQFVMWCGDGDSALSMEMQKGASVFLSEL